MENVNTNWKETNSKITLWFNEIFKMGDNELKEEIKLMQNDLIQKKLETHNLELRIFIHSIMSTLKYDKKQIINQQNEIQKQEQTIEDLKEITQTQANIMAKNIKKELKKANNRIEDEEEDD